MSDHGVRKEFMAEFRGLSANSEQTALIIVVSYVMQLATAIGLGCWILQSPLSFPTGLALGILMFFIGTRLRGFNNIVHECSHFSFSERREDNVVLGSICASLVLGCFADYRDEHMTHHAHLGDYESDLDLQGIRASRLEEPLTPRSIAWHILRPLLGLHFPYYVNVNLTARDGGQYRALKYGLIAAAIVFLLLDPIAALLLVWVPFLWIYTAINYWTDCVDHGGIVASDDELEASRNLPLPRHLSMILFPRNDCYHMVHHLFPQVPAHHLDTCHKRLMTHRDYRARNRG